MKQKISDLLYLCSPYVCFDIEEKGNNTYQITHYENFGQKGLLQSLLGDACKVIHRSSNKKYPELEVTTGVVDGTVKGALVAFRQFLETNLKPYVEETDLDFAVVLGADGTVSTTSPVLTALQDSDLMPKTINGVMEFLTYKVPVFQALRTLSEDYTKFITPDHYAINVDTSIGCFMRREVLGSFGVEMMHVMGFIERFLSTKKAEA